MSERLIDAVCPHCGRVGTTVRVVLHEDGHTKLSRRCTDCGGECIHTFDHDWLAAANNKKLRAEVERQRAEIERLFNEDTKTRHALKGWAFVCPDGGDEPTHERVAAVVAEVERLRETLSWYADQRNHFPAEHRRPGDPDPAVVFVGEPPIMSDGGKRAREALWGKRGPAG